MSDEDEDRPRRRRRRTLAEIEADYDDDDDDDGNVPQRRRYDDDDDDFDDEPDLGMRMLIPVGLSGYAIAAGYLGLISVLLLPAPAAIVFGILGIKDIQRNPKKHGMGRCVFGIVMGGLMLLAVAIGVVFAIINK